MSVTIQSAVKSVGGGGLTGASQSDQEAATSTTVGVTPAVQQFHPSALKFWALASAAGSLITSYNLTSVTDVGNGDITFNIATDFSSANWAPLVGANGQISGSATGSSSRFIGIAAKAAGTLELWSQNGSAGTLQDPPNPYSVAGAGDQ